GILYISLPLSFMVDLRTEDWTATSFPDLELALPLTIIFSLWINDTMAYIVGSLMGKTPLSKVSPRKTWEGTIGGIILTIVTITLLAHYTGKIGIWDGA